MTPLNSAIIFIGDSIIEGCCWDELLDHAHICNQGVGGDTSFGVLKRLPAAIERKPAAILVHVGINDILYQLPSRSTAANYALILEAINSGSPATEIFCSLILPVRGGPPTDIIRLNKKIESFCGLANCVDGFNALADTTGQLPAKYTYDGLHLTAKGYRAFAMEIEKSLDLLHAVSV